MVTHAALGLSGSLNLKGNRLRPIGPRGYLKVLFWERLSGAWVATHLPYLGDYCRGDSKGLLRLRGPLEHDFSGLLQERL